MKQYLLSVDQPDGDPPASIDMDRVMSELEALQDEMKAAGGWVFSGGLHPVSTATVMHLKDGDVLMTDGPYVEGKEHLGGFTIVEEPDLDAALSWARRVTEISTLPVEVRAVVGGH